MDRRQSSVNSRPSGPDPMPFNLPSSTRSGLSNLLIVHVVATGLTLILLLLALGGHTANSGRSPKYMLIFTLFSLPTIILTLLAFLVDILIFVPNLDWGTWVTLVSTVLNVIVGVLICASRRRLNTRLAMKARIAENEEINGQNLYNYEYLEREPSPADKATVPSFTQHEFDHIDPISDNESAPLHTPQLQSSPPRYPRTQQSSDWARDDRTSAQHQAIPMSNFSHAHPAYYTQQAGQLSTRRQGPNVPTQARPYESMSFRSQHPVELSKAPNAQRVVSGPRPMPTSTPLSAPSAQSTTDSYHEDIPPQFDPILRNEFLNGEYREMDARSLASRKRMPLDNFERPPYPKQPRSPGTVSNSSHFTSVSQRGINPQWYSDSSDRGLAMAQKTTHQSSGHRQVQPNFLASNPDFVLPGLQAAGRRLPQSRRPLVHGYSDASPYAAAASVRPGEV